MGSSHLGNTIQKLLRQRGMRPIQLAERAQVNQGQLSQILHGKAYPSIESLRRIAEALEVSAGTLLDGKIEQRDGFVDAVEHLAVAFYSLQQLDSDDRESVLALVQEVTNLLDKPPRQIAKLVEKPPSLRTEVAQTGN